MARDVCIPRIEFSASSWAVQKSIPGPCELKEKLVSANGANNSQDFSLCSSAGDLHSDSVYNPRILRKPQGPLSPRSSGCRAGPAVRLLAREGGLPHGFVGFAGFWVSWVLQGFRGFVGFLGLGFRGVGGSFNSWVLDFKQCAQY